MVTGAVISCCFCHVAACLFLLGDDHNLFAYCLLLTLSIILSFLLLVAHFYDFLVVGVRWCLVTSLLSRCRRLLHHSLTFFNVNTIIVKTSHFVQKVLGAWRDGERINGQNFRKVVQKCLDGTGDYEE